MVMIRAIIRPEKVDEVLGSLLEAGFPAVTKLGVYGRGKQRGLKVGDVHYDELPKEMLLVVVKDDEKDVLINTIVSASRTGETGAFGDGKIFVTPVEEVYTISSGLRDDSWRTGRGADMKEVTAIIRMDKMNFTKLALSEAGFSSLTASKVLGRGRGQVDFRVLRGAAEGREEAIAELGSKPRLIPKRIITIVVPD